MNTSFLKNAFDLVDDLKADFNSKESIEYNYYSLLGEVSTKLVEYRMDHSLSQADLAKKLGISQVMISRYESGDHNISIKALNDLCGRLGITLSLSFNQNEGSFGHTAEIIDIAPMFLPDVVYG